MKLSSSIFVNQLILQPTGQIKHQDVDSFGANVFADVRAIAPGAGEAISAVYCSRVGVAGFATTSAGLWVCESVGLWVLHTQQKSMNKFSKNKTNINAGLLESFSIGEAAPRGL